MLLTVSVAQNSSLFGQSYRPVASHLREATIVESFDGGVKNYYAAGSVAVASGTWYVEEGLVGYSPRDKKMGAKAIRLRDAGKLRTDFDFAGGVGTVTVFSAVFGDDATGKWELYYSGNGGIDWVKAGVTVNATATLQSTLFTVNVSGNVRLEIRKVDGTESRIDIDDISVSPYSAVVDPGDPTPSRDNNMALGNPSNAVASLAAPTNYLMVKQLYTLSYNNDKGTPNWVSWHLSSAWVGNAPRPSDFNADAALPSGWKVVTTSDYTNSGFDRGHLCPAADRDYSDAEIAGTFIMTNMMPQAPNNNQQPWKNLEDYCRTLAEAGNELYIIAGPYGQGGTGKLGGVTNTIAGGKVVVPSYTWKIIVVIPNGQHDVDRVVATTRVIAIWMPNVNDGLGAWSSYRTTVDYIESQTGFDFLSNVPEAIQSVIEAKVDGAAVK